MTNLNFNKKKKQGYKNCLFCKDDIPKHLPILRFKSSEEFILYSSYFYERLSGDKINIYKESKNYFDNYYNNYYKKCSQSNNFFFKSIKYICLKCYEHNLVSENGFSNILNTLQYGINPLQKGKFFKKFSHNISFTTNVNFNKYKHFTYFSFFSNFNFHIIHFFHIILIFHILIFTLFTF